MITITVRIPHQQHNTHAIRLFIIFIVVMAEIYGVILCVIIIFCTQNLNPLSIK